MKTHLRDLKVDCQWLGQTPYEYFHQTACGYVRDKITDNSEAVDCKLCIREMKKKLVRK